MQLDLGFFDDFKGGDKVLLSGDPNEIAALADLLQQFVASNDPSLPIHEHTRVAPRRGTRLIAVATPTTVVGGYAWLCNAQTFPCIKDKLATLGSGHHYFELLDTDVELIASAGEYGRDWWQAHG